MTRCWPGKRYHGPVSPATTAAPTPATVIATAVQQRGRGRRADRSLVCGNRAGEDFVLGFFDRVFKRAGAPPPDASANAIKLKYQGVLQLIEGEHVRVLNLHVEGGRLYLKGAAPTEEARERILGAIRSITLEDDSDIVADITVG